MTPTNPEFASVATAFNAVFSIAPKADPFVIEARAELAAQYTAALLADPQRLVRTPGYPKSEMTIAAVIEDHLGGVGTEAAWHELMCIVAGVAQGQDMHLRAAAWTKQVIEDVAAYQADDLVALWGDDPDTRLKNQVASLRAELQIHRAQSERRATELERRIANLVAITNEVVA